MKPQQGLQIEQLFYGSFSGDRDFGVLAFSAGVRPDEIEWIDWHSNLGGSTLTAHQLDPIYAFYPIGQAERPRWAFARTTFLGRGPRGNDYLVHVLILEPQVVDALRGDVFLLEQFRLFSDLKPAPDTTFDPLNVDGALLEQLSRRECGTELDERPPEEEHARLLKRLSHGGSTGECVEGGSDGIRLCRSIISLLPADDRAQVSFCTRFAVPRPLPTWTSYRFVAYVPEDEPTFLKYYKSVQGSTAGEMQDLAAHQQWCELVGRGLDPISGISILNHPADAVLAVQLLESWGESLGSNEVTATLKRARDTGIDLLSIAAHVRNRTLGRTRRLLMQATLLALVERVQRVMSKGGSLSDVESACMEAMHRVPSAAIMEGFACRNQDPTLAALDAQATLTASVAMAVISDQALGDFGIVYAPDDARAILAGPAEAAAWIGELHRQNQRLCSELLALWFRRWRVERGTGCLPVILGIMNRAEAEGDDDALRTVFLALEKAGPLAEDRRGRESWFLGLVRFICPLSPRLLYLAAARISSQEWLFPFLSREEMRALLPACAEHFPRLLIRELEADSGVERKPYELIAALVTTCEEGLQGCEMGGAGWDCEDNPARWHLGSCVANLGAVAAIERQDPICIQNSAWLVWAASRLIPAGSEGREQSNAERRYYEALETLAKASPAGVSDILVRALYRFARRGLLPALSPMQRQALRRQAWEDGLRMSPADGFFFGTLRRISSLDDSLFAGVG